MVMFRDMMYLYRTFHVVNKERLTSSVDDGWDRRLYIRFNSSLRGTRKTSHKHAIKLLQKLTELTGPMEALSSVQHFFEWLDFLLKKTINQLDEVRLYIFL